MENLTTMTRSQLNNFVETFERNAFNRTAGAYTTVRDIENTLEAEDTTNAVPTVKPSTLTGRPLTGEEVKIVLYSAVHKLHWDIEARDTINEGGTSSLTPITPYYAFTEGTLTDMWVDGYRVQNDYEHMSYAQRIVFDSNTLDFLDTHPLYIVNLNSQLGAILQNFGYEKKWDKSQTAFHAFAFNDGYVNFLIVPENGGKVENMLCADAKEARYLDFYISHIAIPTVNIDNRVNPDDVDVDVVRAFAEMYANLNGIELSDSVLDILARVAADRAEVYALSLDSFEGCALATLWGIPEQPSFADNLALYKAHKVIAMNGNIYSMKQLSVKAA